jgi:hypothetical protein
MCQAANSPTVNRWRTALGLKVLTQPRDLPLARRLMAEAGYRGEPVRLSPAIGRSHHITVAPEKGARRACKAWCSPPCLGMFVITEADAAAIRAVFNQEGELSAVIELRRRFPGVTDNAEARTCARSIAGWTPLPAQLRPVTELRPRKGT